MKYIILRNDNGFYCEDNKEVIRRDADAAFYTRGVSPNQVYQLVQIFGVTRTHSLWDENTPLVVYPGAEEVPFQDVGYYTLVDIGPSDHEFISTPQSREFIGRLKQLIAQYGAEVEDDTIVLEDGGTVTLGDLYAAYPLYTNRLQVKVVLGETSFVHTGTIENVINVVPHNYRDILMTAAKEQRGGWIYVSSCSGSFKDGDTLYRWEFV